MASILPSLEDAGLDLAQALRAQAAEE